MLDLMGIQKERDALGRQILILPDPLRIGDPFRVAPDGSRLWNPDWREDSMFPLNGSFLDAVAELILDHEKVNTDLIRLIITADVPQRRTQTLKMA
jgi:hypothetical protein